MKKTIKILLICSLILFFNFEVQSSVYHIKTENEFINSSSWAMGYDTVYLDNDIDLNDTILNPINTFTGVFNGQGHTIKGINISTNDNAGLFLTTNKAFICNLKLFGKIVSNSVNKEKSVGLICIAKSTTLKNVENHISLLTTSPKARISGFVCTTDASKLLIEECIYCDTIIVRPSSLVVSSYGGTYAFDYCGGIISTLGSNDVILNCLYSGHIWIDVPYNPTPIANKKNSNIVEGYNYDGSIGGIAGYAGKASASSGIRNCLVTGTFNLNGNWFKNQGAIVGITSTAAQNSNNYFYNDTIIVECNTTPRPGESTDPTSASQNPGSSNSTKVTEEELNNGTVCGKLNGEDGDVWGQTIGTDEHPVIGNDNIITDDPSNDYIIDYYYFNDEGDVTLLPDSANTIFISHVKYKRLAKYVKGMMSVCLPFEVSKTDGSLPEGEIYKYSHVDTDEFGYVTLVHFNLSNNQTSINAGEAVFFKPLIEYVDWEVEKYNVYIENKPKYGLIGNYLHEDTIGINGSFNTYKVGTGYFKLNTNGDNLVYTLSNSNCYPYRAYVTLPEGYFIKEQAQQNSAPIRVRFNNSNNDIPTYLEENIDLKPKKIFKNNKILIQNGYHTYTVEGLLYE